MNLSLSRPPFMSREFSNWLSHKSKPVLLHKQELLSSSYIWSTGYSVSLDKFCWESEERPLLPKWYFGVQEVEQQEVLPTAMQKRTLLSPKNHNAKQNVVYSPGCSRHPILHFCFQFKQLFSNVFSFLHKPFCAALHPACGIAQMWTAQVELWVGSGRCPWL